MKRQIFTNYDKNVLLRPPPWFAGHNTTPPNIPEIYTPLQIAEKFNPREPLGPLLSVNNL